MAKRLDRATCVLGLAALALGCARPYYLAPDAPPGSELSSLLLLPFNFDRAAPPGWTEGMVLLSERIDSHLASTGRRVERVDVAELLPVWEQVLTSVGGLLGPGGAFAPGRYEAARSQLARRLAAGRDVDAVVMPSVLSRLAHADGRTRLKWDGVVRRVPLELGDSGDEPVGLTGSFEVSSLRVTVFDPWGERLFERIRGLEPLEVVTVEGAETAYGDRGDLFQDPALLAEEVRVVFEPLIESP